MQKKDVKMTILYCGKSTVKQEQDDMCFGFPSETREPECIDSARSRKLYCQVHDPSEKHAAQNSSQVILSANGLIEWLIGFLFSSPARKECQAVAKIPSKRFCDQHEPIPIGHSPGKRVLIMTTVLQKEDVL